MNFINFTDSAKDCLRTRQLRMFAEREKRIVEENGTLEDPAQKELHIVCLSYDTGVRPNLFYRSNLGNDNDHPFVVDENEKYCQVAIIDYSNEKKCWILKLGFTRGLEFKSLKDATSAALLCTNENYSYVSKIDILKAIAENFPEHSEHLAEEIASMEGMGEMQ